MTITKTLKLLIFVLFSLSFSMLFSSQISAAGNACCENGWRYSNGQCIQVQYGRVEKPNACAENEQCYGSDDNGPIVGVCSEKPITDTCCDSPYTYNKGSCVRFGGNGRMETGPKPSCSNGGWCSRDNLCLTGSDSSLTPFQLCDSVSDVAPSKDEPSPRKNCTDCLGSSGVWTALGCIHFDPQALVIDFLKISLGIAGGLALLLMVYGAFQISVSAGDPKKAQEGREMITGTIAGLLFIIFSVLLLRIIGVEILQIPGLK